MRYTIALVLLAACGGSSSNSPDASTDAAGSDASSDLPSLATPVDTWTWVPFPDSACGNGTPAGIGVNRTEASDDLFVYFAGGGACWDDATCLGPVPTSVHVKDTYTAATMQAEVGGLPVVRNPAQNPFANASVIYVPYCTGDVHSGDNVATYASGSLHHTGASNADQFIAALRVQFPDAANIWVSGSSAGGYGATINFHRFTDRWPSASAHLLQDGSPFVTPQANFAAWKTNWNIQYPPDCTGCDDDFGNVVDAVATRNPDARIGLMHYDNDQVIRQFFGYTSLVAATNTLLDEHYMHANTKAFVVAGDGHTMFGGIASITGPGGAPLSTWVAQWITGASGWTTVRP